MRQWGYRIALLGALAWISGTLPPSTPPAARAAAEAAARAAAPATAAAPAMPAPEQAVVLHPRLSWIAGPLWDGNQAPVAYGLYRNAASPTFRVVDPSSLCLWFYRPDLPVDVSRYPILAIRYRARNLDPNAGYLLRTVWSDRGRIDVFTGSDVVADGQVHELKRDMRQTGAAGVLKNIGIGVHGSDAGDASVEIIEIRFSAADDARPPAKLEDDPPIKVLVKGADGAAVGGAKIVADFERANFARSATTAADGTAQVAPLSNEAGVHMLRIEKDGFVPVEVHPSAIAPEQVVEVSLMPASFYGGVVMSGSSEVLAGAHVAIATPSEAQQSVGYTLLDDLVTDADGAWRSSAMPADAQQVTITWSARGAGGEALSGEIDAASSKVAAPSGTPAPRAVAAASTRNAKPAAGSQIVQKVDGSSVQGTITAIDEKTVTVKPAGEAAIQVPLADVVEITCQATSKPASPSAPPPGNQGNGNKGWAALARMIGIQSASRPPASAPPPAPSATPAPPPKPASPALVPPAGQWLINLGGDDALFATVQSWSDRKLTIQSPSLPAPLSLPVEQVRQIWMGGAANIAKARAMNLSADAQDVVFVAKGSEIVSVAGIAGGIEGDSLLFTYQDQQRKIALSRLVGILLGGRDPDSGESREFEFRQSLILTSGESLTGRLKALEQGNVMLIADAAPPAAVAVPLDRIGRILVRNGRLVYLTDLKPQQVEQVPYFDRVIPFRVNQSLNGQALKLIDGPTTRGVSMHSRSTLGYEIGGRFNVFRARLGFQQPQGRLGRAAVRVLGDGKVLFQQNDVRGDAPPQDLALNVEGVQRLTLEVDFGPDQDVGDWVVFAEPRLIRAGVN